MYSYFSTCALPPADFKGTVCLFTSLLSALVPLLVAVALLVFFWGLVRFMRSAGSEEAVTDAKNIMFWGIVGLFVMISIWGIIAFFFFDFFDGGVGSHPFGLPQLPFSNTSQ